MRGGKKQHIGDVALAIYHAHPFIGVLLKEDTWRASRVAPHSYPWGLLNPCPDRENDESDPACTPHIHQFIHQFLVPVSKTDRTLYLVLEASHEVCIRGVIAFAEGLFEGESYIWYVSHLSLQKGFFEYIVLLPVFLHRFQNESHAASPF